jgi:hypothetical protein
MSDKLVTVGAIELIQVISRLGIQQNFIIPRDKAYALFDRSWIFGPFAQAFEGFKELVGIADYQAEANDCEDLSDWAVCYAKLCHKRSWPNSDVSVAFGTFRYSPLWARPGSHMINCALVPSRFAPRFDLVFFEPQNSSPTTVSPEELRTCSEIRF